jgi:chromosomal replication initiator protein
VTTVHEIKRAVCAHFGVTQAELTGRGRCRSISLPRHIAMYLARDLTLASYPDIGRDFSRDHSTVIAAVLKVWCLSQTDRKTWTALDELYRELGKPVEPYPVGGGC